MSDLYRRKHKKQGTLGIFCLGCAAFLAVVSTTILLPALPEMQRHFQVSPERMQLLLGVVMVSAAFFVVVLGALSHVYDRKRLLLGAVGMLGLAALGKRTYVKHLGALWPPSNASYRWKWMFCNPFSYD